MLFDLRGKRRRFIQVVYALLAALFLIGFVGFGVGSEAGTGGIFDAIGIGGGDDDGSTSPQYDADIEAQQEKLAQDPKDERALTELARLHFLAGRDSLEADEATGQPIVTDDARVQFDESVKAWERYLKVEPKPDANAAGLVVQGYVFLNDAEGAAKTQQIVADARPSQGAFSNLAFYLYAAGDIEGGDEAAKQAVAEAEGSAKSSTRKELAGIRTAAIKQEEKLEKAAKQAKDAPPGENPLQTPLGGGLGGSAPAPAPAP